MHTPTNSNPSLVPQIVSQSCLNTALPDHGKHACKRCIEVCPAEAIDVTDPGTKLPRVNASMCTGCTACISTCPTDAIRHATSRPAALVRDTMQLARQGTTMMTVACSASTNSNADLTLPCHATWTPILLASLAAEGIKHLYLDGIDQCSACPRQFGATIMQQTESDYAALNQSLGVHISIHHGSHKKNAPAPEKASDEPERRSFFRQLIPSLAHGAAAASEQLAQAARLSAEQPTQVKPSETASPLPVRLQLFLRALPKLQSNFMPLPAMPSLPLGAIQADARCTACGECVEHCPTQALHLRAFGSNKILEFKADACIGCSHCIARCPEQALEPLPGISLPAILTGKARPLVMVAATSTSANGTSTSNSVTNTHSNGET